ncbi:MAG: YbfB/YjiJ family MFS transporter, partial [Micromonosporaceae bacterium]
MSARRWRTVRLALGTATALGLGRFGYGLLLPAMATQLEWDLAQAGMLTTANGFGYLAGAMVTSRLANRVGTPATFRIGMLVCVGSLACTAATTDYPLLLAARAVTGAGGALVFIAGAALAPTAGYFAGTGLGILAGGGFVPQLLDHHPERWPAVWICLAVASGLATAASWSAPDTPGTTPHPEPRRTPRPDRLWPVAVAYLMFATGYITYITFLSAYLHDRDASATETSLAWSVLGVAVIVAPGLWHRHLARRPERTLAVLLAVISGSAVLTLLVPAPPAVIVSALAYGGTFMIVPAAVTTLVRANTTPDGLTSALATFTAIFAAGQTAGPWLAGALADRTD